MFIIFRNISDISKYSRVKNFLYRIIVQYLWIVICSSETSQAWPKERVGVAFLVTTDRTNELPDICTEHNPASRLTEHRLEMQLSFVSNSETVYNFIFHSVNRSFVALLRKRELNETVSSTQLCHILFRIMWGGRPIQASVKFLLQ